MAAPSYHLTNFIGTTNPAANIIALIEADLTAAGWVFVEQAAFTQASSARYLRVWKCPASLNIAGVDFHIGLVRNQAAGTYLAARAFEGYNAIAHTIQRPCIPGSYATAPVQPEYVGSNASFALDNSLTPAFTELLPNVSLVASANYDVGVLASKSYLVVNVQPLGTATMGLTWFLGLFEPAHSDSASFPPLAAVDLRSTSLTGVSGVSRSPQVASGPSAFAVVPFPESMPFGLFPGAAVEATSKSIRATRIALSGTGAAAGFTGAGAAYRGRLYDAVALATGGSSTAIKVGDSVTIGPNTYTALGSSPATQAVIPGSSGWFFNTAAGT